LIALPIKARAHRHIALTVDSGKSTGKGNRQRDHCVNAGDQIGHPAIVD